MDAVKISRSKGDAQKWTREIGLWRAKCHVLTAKSHVLTATHRKCTREIGNGGPHARTRVCTRGRSSYSILYLWGPFPASTSVDTHSKQSHEIGGSSAGWAVCTLKKKHSWGIPEFTRAFLTHMISLESTGFYQWSYDLWFLLHHHTWTVHEYVHLPM